MIRQQAHPVNRDGAFAEVLTKLKTAYFRVQNALAAQRLWEYLSEAQRCQLGNDLEAAYRNGGTLGIWSRTHGTTTERSIIDVARLLGFIDEPTERWLLRETHEGSDDPDEALLMALDRADLVLVYEPRAIYWERAEVDVNWYRRSKLWDYFATLVERAKQGRGVDGFDFSEQVKPDNHIKLKSRLVNDPGFPVTLGTLIDSDLGGRQRLNLIPHRIEILPGVPAGV